jgi:hypothetical protein
LAAWSSPVAAAEVDHLGLGGPADGRLTGQGEKPAFDVTVYGALDRDVTAADQVAVECRAGGQDRVLYGVRLAGGGFVFVEHG